MDLTFEEQLASMRSRIADMNTYVACEETAGFWLVNRMRRVSAELQAFMQQWRDDEAQVGLACVATTIAGGEHHDEALFLINLIMLMQTRRLLHIAGLNEGCTEMILREAARANGQQHFELVNAEAQAQEAFVDAEFVRGLNALTANWPDKADSALDDRLQLFEPGDFDEWDVEIRERLVRLCLESNFPVAERTQALRIIGRL